MEAQSYLQGIAERVRGNVALLASNPLRCGASPVGAAPFLLRSPAPDLLPRGKAPRSAGPRPLRRALRSQFAPGGRPPRRTGFHEAARGARLRPGIGPHRGAGVAGLCNRATPKAKNAGCRRPVASAGHACGRPWPPGKTSGLPGLKFGVLRTGVYPRPPGGEIRIGHVIGVPIYGLLLIRRAPLGRPRPSPPNPAIGEAFHPARARHFRDVAH